MREVWQLISAVHIAHIGEVQQSISAVYLSLVGGLPKLISTVCRGMGIEDFYCLLSIHNLLRTSSALYIFTQDFPHTFPCRLEVSILGKLIIIIEVSVCVCGGRYLFASFSFT